MNSDIDRDNLTFCKIAKVVVQMDKLTTTGTKEETKIELDDIRHKMRKKYSMIFSFDNIQNEISNSEI